MLRAGSFCVWYIWSGTAAHGWVTNVQAGPACSEALLRSTAPFSGAEGYSDSQRKAGFLYVLLCMRVHAHDKERNKQNLHTCDMKPRHSLREPHPWFPFGKGSLLPGGCVLHPMSTVRISVTPGLVLFLDRFHSRHFWPEYVRNWRVAADSRS